MSKLNDLDALTVPFRLKLAVEWCGWFIPGTADDKFTFDLDWEILDFFWLNDLAAPTTPERSCFNCKHANISSGYPGNYHEPPTPAEYECDHPNHAEFYELYSTTDEDTVAEHCPFYQAIPTGNCAACGNYIDAPSHLWHLYEAPNLFDMVPVCSEKCCQIIQSHRQAAEAAYMEMEFCCTI